ncbi:glyoxalase/bleomycin resistance/extradiol dioxygenase family protein [Algoriphagus sp.]|uniref:glyoxalase/bleomycin resistance/extradiol dioxygenase family protein n=1 Tax=Algoriphagus sp. TaxID=1872435 RepID=UPI003F72668A
MKTKFLCSIPVLPSQDIVRDLEWYAQTLGFVKTFGDHSYAGMRLEEVEVHLQRYSATGASQHVNGSVVKIFVKNIEPFFEALVIKGVVNCDHMNKNTAWGTHEFRLTDLNKNAIFIVEDIESSAEKTS